MHQHRRLLSKGALCAPLSGQAGFTFIELSIVLVVIGLVVGAILVGTDLIHAAAVRAQISQIQQFHAATNTFRAKYNYLPGDIVSSEAAALGMKAHGTLRGQGDGNGLIEGNCDSTGDGTWIMYCDPSYALAGYQGAGETGLFWVDLSQAGLIPGTFSTATCCNMAGSPLITLVTPTTTPNIGSFWPKGKLGEGYYVLVSNGKYLGYGTSMMVAALSGNQPYSTMNFFVLGGGVETDGYIDRSKEGTLSPGIPVMDAYNIDQKMDDGLPVSGSVIAVGVQNLAFDDASLYWTQRRDMKRVRGTPDTSPTPVGETSCYDNGNANGQPQKYSVGYNGGNEHNCSLGFRMQ